MSKSCECCKRYWNHLHGKVKCFVRLMNGNTRHSMVIPESFVNHFSKKISGTVKLEAPNGNVYDVVITERRSRTVLRAGWEAFVHANHIVENDLLMFQYRGNSSFKVIVFDSSGCEKVVSCAHIESNISDKEPSTSSTDMSSSSSDRNTQSSERGNSDGSSGHCRKRARKDEMSGEDNPYEHESSASDDHALSEPLYVLSGQCYLTEEQEAEIFALVQDIQPEMPLLVAVMKQPNVKTYPDLVIPKDYAFAHFPHKNQTITVQLPGQSKKWHCQFCVRSDGGRCNLYGCDFVGDNHLQEGDLCLFQPTTECEGRTFRLTVYLLRKASIGSNCGLGNTKVASTVHVKEEPDDGEENSSSDHEQGISEQSPEHDDTYKSSGPPYMMSIRAHLLPVQEKKVLEKVEAIQSELPIYVAVMTKTNVLDSLEFCSEYAAAHLPGVNQTVLLEFMGKVWETQMVVGDAKRWRLMRGWSKFVHDNLLQVGDITLFELKKNEMNLTMAVHIFFFKQ